MTLPELIARAIAAYPFRPQHASEPDALYRDALIHHVQRHDFAMAHELRVGRLQAEWTPEDVLTFKEHILAARGPREDLAPGPHVLQILEDSGGYNPDDETLLGCGRGAMHAMVSQRRAEPRRQLPVLISALLGDGRMLHVPVRSDDRLAILTELARRFPLYGYLLVFDGWIHHMTTLGGLNEVPRASKRDALFVNIGSRTLRRILIQPYSYAMWNGSERAVILETEQFENDPRDKASPTQVMTDPYAAVFVTVDAPERVQ